MSTKQTPGAYDCYSKLAEDEPYFLLRAKDATAPGIVREWVRRRRNEAIVKGGTITPDYERKLREAELCALEMDAWHGEHAMEIAAAGHETPRTHVPGDAGDSER